MGEDLKKLNKAFEELWKIMEITLEKKLILPSKKLKGLFYLTFLKGFEEGSGMTQIVQ